MKLRGLLKGLAGLCLLAVAPIQAAPIATIDGSVVFTGDLFGQWSISFASDAPGLELRSVTIKLPTPMGFDTQPGGFGVPSSQDFHPTSGPSVSALNPVTPDGREGQGTLRIDFQNFNSAAGQFLFDMDVDWPLGTLPICAGGPEGYDCNRNNGNLMLAAAAVNGGQIAGTKILLNFGGGGFGGVNLETILTRTGDMTATGTYSGTAIAHMPEPSTYALMGLGLAGLGFLRNRKR